MRIGIDNMLEVKEKRGVLSTEKSFEKYFKAVLEYDLDVKTFKLTGHRGIPDRFVFPNHFVELKVVTLSNASKVNIHKGWRETQKKWAARIHNEGARSWICVLVQEQETGLTHFYLEPAVYSLWVHDKSTYSLKNYYKNMLMCRGRDREQVKDHIWQRLIEVEYYDRTFERFPNKAKTLSADIYAFKGHTKRMAP
jgi:hypothetical protein